ncbi:MAG: cell division ATP-binding protein FtsE, partial [Firmicutes bacterium]|nr:cell division ATP-binding protein FtsE [Bacillota bacterium]
DPDTAWEIMDLLDQINLRGTTIVMVTHAKDIVDRMKKRVIAIEAGRVVRDEQGVYGFEQAAPVRKEAAVQKEAAAAQPEAGKEENDAAKSDV